MIAFVIPTILGGLITFAAWAPQGITKALILAPFGGSAAAIIMALAIAAKNPE